MSRRSSGLSALAALLLLTACGDDEASTSDAVAASDASDVAAPPGDAGDRDTSPDVQPDSQLDAADTQADIAKPDAAPELPPMDDASDAADAADVSDLSDGGPGDVGPDDVAVVDIPVYVEGDDCSDAIVVPMDSLPFQIQASTTYASDDYSLAGGCGTGGNVGGAGGRDLVFSLTPQLTGFHVLGLTPQSTVGANPSIAYVVTDCAAVGASCVSVSEGLLNGGLFTAFLEADVTYFVVIDGLLPGDAGRFTFSVNEAVCVPQCPGPECGKDGCGGFCGEGCSDELACSSMGLCEEPPTLEGNTCPYAWTIAELPFSVTRDTWYGTNDISVGDSACPGEPDPIGGASNDHAYRLDAEVSGFYTISLQAQHDAAMYVVRNCKLSDATCVAGVDETLTFEQMVIWLDAGETYFVVVDGASNDENDNGRYTLGVGEPCVPDCAGLECGTDGCGGSCGECGDGESCDAAQQCVAAALGDHCLDPYLVGEVPYLHEATTEGFDNDYHYEAGQCPGVDYAWGAASPDVVYSFTAPKDDVYLFEVQASFDSTLYLVEGCDILGTSSCLAAADESPLSGEVIERFLDEGQRIFVIVDGYGNISSPAGPYSLSITPACLPQCEGKVCGPDGCGSTCGQCEGALQCTPEGTCYDQPGNACSTPFEIDAVPFQTAGSTADAKHELGVPYDACPGETSVRGAKSKDEVYRFTPQISGVYTFAVEADFGASVYVITDCSNFVRDCFLPVDPGALVWWQVSGDCEDWSGQCRGIATEFTQDFSSPTLRVFLDAGKTYFVVVDGQSFNYDSSGPYTLSVSEPCFPQCEGKSCGSDQCGLTCGKCVLGEICADAAGTCSTQEGNTCDTAFVVGELPYMVAGNTTDATNVYGMPRYECPDQENKGGGGSNDEVYAFTPPADGHYDIIVSSAFEHIVYVVTECPGYHSTCFFKETLGYNSWTANQPFCEPFPDQCLGVIEGTGGQVKVELEASTTYYVVVDGRAGLANLQGAYNLEIREACEPLCEGKECGPDGCGEQCGECPGGFTCDAAGQCQDGTTGAGDTCVDPWPVSTLPFIGTGDTSLQSHAYEGGSCSGIWGAPTGTKDEVWEFVPPVSGVYQFNVAGDGTFEPIVFVVQSCTDAEFSCVGGTDAQVMSLTLTGQQTYHVIVDAGDGGAAEGSYALEITKP